MDQYYTTGEFARMAHVTIRTIRYYDKKGLLKPSFINESGYRMYSDEDFLKLQKILSLKYLGFSLNEIGNMTIHDTSADILKSLKMQIGLVHKKMENLEQMEKALQNTTQILEETNQIDWTGILNLIHLTDMDGSRGFWNRWILTVRAGFWRLAAETDSSGKKRSHPC